MNKLKLLSSLTTIVATTSLVATSCAVVNKNSNNDTIANGIDVATIPWITRTKYDYKSDTTIQTDIVSTVYNDNVSIFARYPGLEDEISITATVNSGQVTIDVIVTTPIIYEGNTSWTATYDYEPLPIDGELNINTSTINDTMYVNTTAYDKKCEIFASTKVNNVITAVNISKVDVTLSGSGITTATGSVENNQGYVNLTIGTTAGVARLIIKVIDSKNNVGSVELIITVKKKWESIGYTTFITLATGISSGSQMSLYIDRDAKVIIGWISITSATEMGTAAGTTIANFNSGYATGIRQGGSISGHCTGSWYSIDGELKVHPSTATYAARLSFYYVYAIN